MNTYLIAFDPSVEGHEALIDFLDSIPQIENWHTSMLSTVVVTSSLDASELTEMLRNRFPGTRFLITGIEADTTNGVLPRATWDFLAARKATSPQC